jgi:proline dehydrogenase
MIQSILSPIAKSSLVRKAFLSMPGVRNFAWEVVAGESLENGIDTARRLDGNNIKGTLNFVGTHSKNKNDVMEATENAINSLKKLNTIALEPNISIKLTKIGLDIEKELCRENITSIIQTASQIGGFVCIDMEETRYVDYTIEIFQEINRQYNRNVGIALQSYLKRTKSDLTYLVNDNAFVRIVKGGYWERGNHVYKTKHEINTAFNNDIDLLMDQGRYPAIATHDRTAIKRVMNLVEIGMKKKDEFEFQMLYGVDVENQQNIISDGYRLRCYVPFGKQWYEYMLGCIRKSPLSIFSNLRRYKNGENHAQ